MGYAKVWKRKKCGHMKVQEEKRDIWTHEGPIIYMKKWWAHEGSCKMIAMFSEFKFMREITHQGV